MQLIQIYNSSADFCGGTAQFDSRVEVPSRQQQLRLTHREQNHTSLHREARLTEDGAGRPSGTVETNIEVVILPSWLGKGY